MEDEKIILIGAGSVAHHLAVALLKAGCGLCQIYSRNIESARVLGMRTGISYTANVNEIYPDGDVYLFCVSDDALPSVLKTVRVKADALLLHTSGSQPMEMFKGYSARYGVIYPVQTFSKKRDLDFREIPLCIEGSSPTVTGQIRRLAEMLSEKVYAIDSDQRKVLHLAAVFACNFPNFLYGVAEKMLKGSGLPFSILRPLIYETAHKVMLLTPEEAQTGPAYRGDESILNFHKTMLKGNEELLKLYTLLSDMIKVAYHPEIKAPAKAESGDTADMPTLW